METKFKIGIDCGGSKIEGILLDSAGNQIERKRTTYKKNYDSFIKTINSLVTHLEGIANSLCTVGIGIPGFSSKLI